MISVILFLLVVVVAAGGAPQVGRYGASPYQSNWPQLAILAAAAFIIAARAFSR
jgi:hypothetical protein